MDGEEYECLVISIASIDTAIAALMSCEINEADQDALHEMRNRLNARRVAMLGSGAAAPFKVSDLIELMNDDGETT